MAILIMAQQSKSNHKNAHISNSTCNISTQQQPTFHDFLGMKATDSPVPLASKVAGDARLAEASRSPSASLGASSGGGGRGPISSTSDLGSVERKVVSHLEGVPYYGPRSDISGPEISSILLGSKRSNSDSAFMGSSRDGIQQTSHDSLESLHLMKMLRNGIAGDRPKRSKDDEVLFSIQALRHASSLNVHPPIGSRIDSNASKWERAIAMNASPAIQYPPRGGQFVPFIHQVPPNRFRDTNASPSILSQSAADEGSRTGMKGPGTLSSINASSCVTDKNSSGLLPSGIKPKSGIHYSEPESSAPSSRQGLTAASRQMTIFYGGQAHVFDDVHPNKADVIMALAGSNGGSWSTTYSPKSSMKPVNESHMSSGEYEAIVAGNTALPRDFRGRLSVTGSVGHGVGSGDHFSTSTGAHQGVIVISKDSRNPVQAGEASAEEKREV
ncbi:tify domain-containing protein [Cephalotus follicularis]|uniref:Protein TIFY n=1 Tax=Cephalotus follicularis TaxID=3775 RepID=A0A1Q3C435_CEPFO|nr:tify domain-containing protein [Cephalotus follicularis]